MMKLTQISLVIFLCVIFSCQNPDEPTEPTPSPEQTPGQTEEPAPTPGIIPPVVVNVRATKLQYTDHIRIVWDTAAGAESYIVYRYLHKSEGSFDKDFKVITNYIDDTTALPDTPYFYKVASVIDSATSDLSAHFAEGIYSSFSDPFEPNDTLMEAEEISTEESGAGIYSFTRGEAQDKDWYVYTGPATLMNIKVILPPGSPFDGELTLEIENNGSSISLSEGENTLSYSGPDDLYFSILFNAVDPEIDTVGTYTVFIVPVL